MKKINVILADGHPLVRQWLRALIHREKDIELVGEANDGRNAVALAKKLKPDVVVLDVALPVMNGLEATRLISLKLPTTKVLVLSTQCDDAYVDRLMKCGASGFLIKHTAEKELLHEIRQAQKASAFYNPSLARRLRQGRKRLGAEPGRKPYPPDQLSGRQEQVLHLVSEGMTNKSIAAELSVGIKTVEKYRQKVMKKLKVHNLAGLMRYAIGREMLDGLVGKKPIV